MLHVGTPRAQAAAVNAARLSAGAALDGAGEEDAWGEAAWEELAARFEEPDGMNRWDRPCWVVGWGDAALGAGSVGTAMWEEGVLGVAGAVVRPNAAAVAPRSGGAGELAEVERITQEVVAQVGRAREVGGETAPVELGEGGRLVVRLPPGGVPSFAQMQRLRRQWVQLQRSQPGMVRRERVGVGFVDWLNGVFEAE